MNKKLLLLFILCSATSTILSDDFFAEKLGDWPEELEDWRQSTGVSDCESRYLRTDTLGRHIAEVTSPRGVQYHFYRVEGENGPISETARPVGTNEEVPLIKAYKKTTNKTTFIWPEQAGFIKSCVDTDQLEAPSDDISILHDGTGPPPDEDPFEKKLKQENPRVEKAYQEIVEEMRGLKDIRNRMHKKEKELKKAQDSALVAKGVAALGVGGAAGSVSYFFLSVVSNALGGVGAGVIGSGAAAATLCALDYYFPHK